MIAFNSKKTLLCAVCLLALTFNGHSKTPTAEKKQEITKIPEKPTEKEQNDPVVSDATALYLSSQPYVVSIEIRTTEAAYSTPGTSFGTGCILDKDQGIILTNAHVATPDGIIDHYDITLHDGSVTKAQLLYNDPWHDFALLKTDPKSLASIPHSLPTQRNAIQLGEPVLIIGKNENKHFSMQSGTVANPYETTEQLPGQVFRISLNAQGGASGSPVINTSGKAIGLVYASNGLTSAFALPIDYALDALEALNKGKTPTRFGTGMIAHLISLEEIVRHDGLTEDVVKDYTAKFPFAFSRILRVKNALAGSPAEGLLLPGDVILKVNGQEVGPSLYKLDKIINDESQDHKSTVTFDIIRHGKPLNVKIPTYDLHAHSVKRMLSFGKAIFYETSDEIIERTGAARCVFVTNLKPGGSFYDVIPALQAKSGGAKGLVAITSIEGKIIKTLDDVQKLLPDLMKKNHFYITIKNYGTEYGGNGELFFNQNEQIRYASFYPSDGLPELYTFDDTSKKWELKVLS